MEAVDKALAYTVFRESCYDNEDDPEDTWGHRIRLARRALDAPAMLRRDAFAVHVLGLLHTVQWYFHNLVWCDLCIPFYPERGRRRWS